MTESTQTAVNAWERQDGESDSAWVAYRAYRDLPPVERSLVSAFVEYSEIKTGKTIKRPKCPPGYFSAWCASNGWVDRVLAFDRHQDAKAVAMGELDHTAKLNCYRDRLQKYSASSVRAGIRAMAIIEQSLESMELELEKGEGAGVIPPQHLPKFVMATAKLFETAAEQEGRALAVDSLLEVLTSESQKLH